MQRLGHLPQQLVRGLGPVGLFQHRPGILQPALCHRPVGAAQLVELVQNLLGLLRIQEAQLRHLNGELLHVLRLHVLIQRGGAFHPQRDDDGGGPLGSGELDVGWKSGFFL